MLLACLGPPYLAALPAALADEPAGDVLIRLYGVQASGLSTYDCSVQVELHNRMDVTIKGFAATITFLDADGAPIARKPMETTRIRPDARRREGLGFKFDPPAIDAPPGDMTELIGQCAVLAAAEVRLRACETDRGSIFTECQARLAAHSGSALAITIRDDGVAESVDYGVVAVPRGYRVDVADTMTIERLGLTVSTISEALADARGLSPAVEGLLVVAAAPGGPAAQAGLRADDVVVEIDQDLALSHADAARQVAAALADGRRSVLVLVDRDGEVRFAVLRFPPNGAE